MTDLEKYSTTDLIKIWAKHMGWSIDDAKEAIDVARSNKEEARAYFMFLVESIEK